MINRQKNYQNFLIKIFHEFLQKMAKLLIMKASFTELMLLLLESMKPINYFQTSEFNKDFKKFLKRFGTLKEDFEIMKKSATEAYHLKNVKTNAVVKMQNFCGQDYLSMKVRRMTCKSLKWRGVKSGLRVMYVFEQKENKVTFIEMYYKQDQKNDIRKRLSAFIDNTLKNNKTLITSHTF